MRFQVKGIIARTVCALCVVASLVGAEAAKELLHNGDLTEGSGTTPAIWGGGWGTDMVNRFLHLTGGTATASASLTVALSGQRAVQLSWRMRSRDLVHNVQNGQDAVLAVDFVDGAGRIVLPGPAYPGFAGSTVGWQKGSLRCFVPPAATALRLTPTLTGQTGGSLDLDAFSLTALHPIDVPEETQTNGHFAVDLGKGLPPQLHIDGRRIIDADGKDLWLQGLAVPSLEWSAVGDAVMTSIATGIEVWKANVIRLPVSGEIWFGHGQGQGDGGKGYRELIDQAVLAAGSRGAYLILDLHRRGAPEAGDVAFWKEAAARYRNHPTVLFGLFHEPRDLSWHDWKSGGAVGGMQGLIDAVRGAGARNPVVVAGPDEAYDLSGVLKGFDLDDRDGLGIIWDTHVYPWRRGWQGGFLDLAKVRPVLVGEVGCDRVRYDYVPPAGFEDPYTWAPDMIGCIQQNRLHWTAGSFHPKCQPAMVRDQTTFEPTAYWGAFVKAALLGNTFTPVRLR